MTRARTAWRAWVPLVWSGALLVLDVAGCSTAAPAPPAPAAPPVLRARPAPHSAPPPPEHAAPAPAPAPAAPPPAPAPAPPAAPPGRASDDDGARPNLERGKASYYSDALAGRKTASGERYDPGARTCAHPKHRFGTILVVEAVGSGRRVWCRVNDRGPYSGGRVVDVSKALARDLAMVRRGIIDVRIWTTERMPTE